MQRLLTFVLFVSLLISARAAAQSLLARLELDRNRTLPGIPVTMRITVTNPSSVDTAVPGGVVVEITPPSGPSFIARWGIRERFVGTFPQQYRDFAILKRGETQTYELPVDSDFAWSAPLLDPRLQHPGTYLVRVGLADGMTGIPDWTNLHSLSDLAAVAPALRVTNQVSLRVDEVSGEDTKAWQKILDASQGYGLVLLGDQSLANVARTIWEQYPTSRYAPYAGLFLYPRDAAERKRVQARVRQLDPQNPLLDWLPLGTAENDAQLSGDLAHRDLQRALTLNQKAREELEDLIKSGGNAVVRLEAKRELVKLLSPDALRELHQMYVEDDAAPSPNPGPVKPLLSCSESDDDGTTVWFGYDNRNNPAKTIPVGPNNHFDPDPADRGQPTKFIAGLFPKQFKIRAKKSASITWVLDGTSLVVDPTHAAKCSGDDNHE